MGNQTMLMAVIEANLDRIVPHDPKYKPRHAERIDARAALYGKVLEAIGDGDALCDLTLEELCPTQP